ncbi:Cna B-type domain-containing protein [bacterium]|nr:Cna B-type domain-containing protein [bacterium]
MKKKLLSALLAAGMLFTMAPAVAMAEPAQQTSKSQIVYGGEPVTCADGAVTVNKEVEGTGEENVFNITLTVTTTEQLEEIETSPDAAAVLVIDRSGSMEEITTIKGSSGQKEEVERISAAKTAARNFVNSFIVEGENAPKRLVSIVSFASNAKKVIGWSSSQSDLTRAIRGIKVSPPSIFDRNDRETNMEAGLQLALNLIKNPNDPSLNGISNVNVILLTDGCPTQHIDDNDKTNRYNLNVIRGVTDNSNGVDSANCVDYQPVVTVANEIKNTSVGAEGDTNKVALYSIAFATGNADFQKVDDNGKPVTNIWGRPVYKPKNVYDWLNGFSDAYKADNGDSLNQKFQNIINRILLGAKAWLVTDPMGANILYKDVDESFKDANVTSYDNETETLTWDLKKSSCVTETSGSSTSYTYKLKYKIVLDTENLNMAPESHESAPVDTNGKTTLTYALFSKMNDDQIVPSEPDTVDFKVPQVKAKFGTLTFTKTDPNGNPLQGATFTLEGTATGSRKPVTLTTTSGKDGTVSFDKIPAGTYTLTETTPPEGYNACASYNVTVSYGQTTVTRNGDKVGLDQVVDDYASDPITISGAKSWTGDDEALEKRPDEITIRLWKNGQPTDMTTTATAEGNWAYSFSDLAPYDGNTKNVYTITEKKVPEYNASYDNYNVTNTYSPTTTNVNVAKVWRDAENQDGKRPQEITVWLWINNEKSDQKITLNLDNNWRGSFKDLPILDNGGAAYVYTVEEDLDWDKENNYTNTITGDAEDGFFITNTHTPETVNISGSKTWDDGGNQDGIRPDSITIRLLADGKQVAVQNVTEEKQWSWNFGSLPKYRDGGVEIKYTIAEDAVKGYVAKVDDNSYNVTNTHIPATVDINVAKSWNDDGDRDGKRPNSVEIQLYRTLTKDDSAEEYDVAIDGKKLNLNESNGWKGTFTDLPANEAGVPIQYTVKESNVSEDYVSSVDKIEDGSEDVSFIITNSYTPESITVCGSKTWDDQNNKDGVRPACIVIRLYADGEQVAVQNVTEKEQWSWNFGSLPKYRDGGVEIKYTITEDAVEGYTATVNGYDVTNTHTVKPTATPAPTAAPTARPDDPAPTATPTPAPAVAQTSDNSHPMLWVALLVVAAIGMTGVVVLKKRQNNK